MSKQPPENGEIVYADCDAGLVFIPKGLALELAQIHTAMDNSKTWGEFQDNVPTHVYEEVISAMQDDEDPEAPPRREDTFDPHVVTGYNEGDWPIWPLQYMLDWMPKDIQQRFGKVVPTMLNGNCLGLEPEKVGEIVKALEEQGFSCNEDESLVMRASGYI